jgi:tRNA 2-thiocytidine biosynthesis protein TtcA
LYSAADRLGCNKLALGHHRDDGLETFLMNLFYSGKLQAMPAAYTTDDGKLEVIRPLIGCAEATIREFAELSAFPILPCNLCGSQPGLKRERMTELLDQLERESPHLRAVMANALSNVRPTHLLDRDLLKVWAERPEDVRPKPLAPRAVAHHRALPLVSVGATALVKSRAGDEDLR